MPLKKKIKNSFLENYELTPYEFYLLFILFVIQIIFIIVIIVSSQITILTCVFRLKFGQHSENGSSAKLLDLISYWSQIRLGLILPPYQIVTTVIGLHLAI